MIEILLKVVGGLGIFMLGMKFMSEGMQTIAGTRLRQMISKVTDNRVLGVCTGATFTLLIQSSSIATVIMVGLINAGLMKFRQAIGFIMGANIGTTITGWILVLNISAYGLPIAGVSALVFVFSKRERIKFVAMALLGLGLVFFGLMLMKEGVAPVKDMPEIKAWIQRLTADGYLNIVFCVGIGCLLTVMVQSSSAALGILVAAASTGLVSFPVAAAVILGENIGTTITVVIASTGANTNAKRAAAAHVLFNLIGVTWMVIAFPAVIRIIAASVSFFHGVDPMTMNYAAFEAAGDIPRFMLIMTASIAAMHTTFNLLNTCVFLPFVPQFASLIERLIPIRASQKPHLLALDAGSVQSPVLGIEQSRRELVLMGQLTQEMIDWVRQLCYDGKWSDELLENIKRRERTLDNIERELVAYLTQILENTVPQSIVEEGRNQLRLAHEFESIGDFLSRIVNEFTDLREQTLEFDGEQTEELIRLHEKVYAFLVQFNKLFESSLPISGESAKAESKKIAEYVVELQEAHLRRIVHTNIASSLTIAYSAIMTHYSRVRAHVLNSYQAVNGTKSQPKPVPKN